MKKEEEHEKEEHKKERWAQERKTKIESSEKKKEQ